MEAEHPTKDKNSNSNEIKSNLTLHSLNFKNSEERLQFFSNLEQEVMREIREDFVDDDFSLDDSQNQDNENEISFIFQGDAASIDTEKENMLVRAYE